MKRRIIFLFIFLSAWSFGYSQKTDTAKTKILHPYFIITAGEQINAYFNDKPLNLSTIEEFNDYVQKNAKSLKDANVVVTGKPKTGTFDEVMKALKRNRIKNISQNIKE